MHNEKDTLILQFVAMMAKVRKNLRVLHIELEKMPQIASICVDVSPAEYESGDLRERVSLAFFLDARLRDPLTPEQYSLGLSLLVKHDGEKWITEGEIGWSGGEPGWRSYIEQTLELVSIEDLLKRLPPFAKEVADLYRKEVAGNIIRNGQN